MPVTAASSVESQRPVGDLWPIVVDIRTADGFHVSETPVVTVTLPDGSTATPAVESTVGGCYRAQYALTVAGRHIASVTTTAYGAAGFVVEAVSPTQAGGMPQVADVNAYLGTNSWTNADIASALAAETASQRATCAIPAHYPDDLREALLRRVARTLGMRRAPLAQPIGDAEAGGSVIPPYDPEINRLERPHKRMLVA